MSKDNQTPQLASSQDQQIACLAYSLWEQRGRPEGSSEVDWFRAIVQLSQNGATIKVKNVKLARRENRAAA